MSDKAVFTIAYNGITLINEYIQTGAYRVITAQFEGNLKWRLTNGQDRITASLNDKDFVEKIDSNEVSIAKDDLLILEIKTAQWLEPNGDLKAENEIIRVIEHRKKPKQFNIPFEDKHGKA